MNSDPAVVVGLPNTDSESDLWTEGNGDSWPKIEFVKVNPATKNVRFASATELSYADRRALGTKIIVLSCASSTYSAGVGACHWELPKLLVGLVLE